MTDYLYTKSPVDIDTLTESILASSIDSTTFDYSTFDSPDRLKLVFVGDLSVPDKTTLDSIVAVHTGIQVYTESGLIAVADGSGGTVYVEPSTVSGVPYEYIMDGNGDVDHYLDSEAIVQDQHTSISGTFLTMQVMSHRRELFNDTDNPLYVQEFTPLLGASGTIQSINANLDNINTALSKNGWYTQYIKNWTYPNPQDLLIYYGWLNSFNSATNGWSNEKVAQDMAKYNYIVLGDGIQSSSHGDYANTSIIVPRIQALNQHVQIFGYVTINQSLANFQTKVDEWNTLGVEGIFLDEAGYDYGTNRAGFNTMVDYVHNKTTANICFANAWNINHVIGTDNDTSYPNTTWNSGVVESKLTNSDWFLLESYPINTAAYSSTGGYESRWDWATRGSVASDKRYEYGINLAAVGIINNANTNGQDLFNFGFVSAMVWNLDSFGTSDSYYGASSAAVKRWNRPSTAGLGREWAISPAVQNDVSDNDKYHRYLDFGRLTLDFSSSAQVADIDRFTPPDTEKIKFYAGDLIEGTDASPAKTTASGNPLSGLAFDDTTEEAMYGMFEVPSIWKHGTDVSVRVYFFNDYSQTGDKDCRWCVDYQIYDELDIVSDKTTTTVSVNHDIPTDASADTFMKSAVTMSYNDSNNPINRDGVLSFRVYRDATSGSDTMTNDANFVLLIFEFEKEVI